MKRFFLRLIVFLSPLLLFLVVELYVKINKDYFFSESYMQYLFHKEANSYSWVEGIESDSIKILCGSSSVKYGLSCKVLNGLAQETYKYVNIANDARDPIATYFILKNMDLKNVSTIYFGLDPWIYTKRYYQHRTSHMTIDLDFVETFKFAREYDAQVFKKKYNSIISRIVFKNDDSEDIKPSTIPKDFGSVALKRVPKNFNEPIEDYFQIEKYGWSDLQFKYLKKIENLCQKQTIKFIVFIPPKRSDYTIRYKEKCATIHTQFIDKISKTGLQASIFGKFDQLDNYGDKVNFAEAYHLNAVGQIKYSKMFYELSETTLTKFSKTYSWFQN